MYTDLLYFQTRTLSHLRTTPPFPAKSLFVFFWRHPPSQSCAARYSCLKMFSFLYPITSLYQLNIWLLFQGLNFSGADLSRLDLRYINFKMANLSRCNLTHANLCCSNLERADLSGANLDVSLRNLFLSALNDSCGHTASTTKEFHCGKSTFPTSVWVVCHFCVIFNCWPSCWWTMGCGFGIWPLHTSCLLWQKGHSVLLHVCHGPHLIS